MLLSCAIIAGPLALNQKAVQHKESKSKCGRSRGPTTEVTGVDTINAKTPLSPLLQNSYRRNSHLGHPTEQQLQPQPSNVTSTNVWHRRQGKPHTSHPARPRPKQTLPVFSRKIVTVVVGPNRQQVLNLNSSHLRPLNIALRCTRRPYHGILPACHRLQSKAQHVLATLGGRDHS